MELSEENKQERLKFAEKISTIGPDRCVFLGQYTLGEETLWCSVTNLRESNLVIDYGGIHSGFYAAFLDETVLPIWDTFSNVTFVHMKSRITRSNLVMNWISIHPNVKFIEWPRAIKEVYPLNGVWPYFNDKDIKDESDIYDRWELLKEDLSDFRHLYTNLKSHIRNIVWSRGDRIDLDSDGESGISDDSDG